MTTSEDIANGVVAIFNAMEERLVEVDAVNPPEVPQIDVETARKSIQVYPFEEADEFNDGDSSTRRLTVAVLVHTPVSSAFKRADGIAWVGQLRQALEGAEIGDYLWQENETVSLWDFDALKDKRQFQSLFRATFYDIN